MVAVDKTGGTMAQAIAQVRGTTQREHDAIRSMIREVESLANAVEAGQPGSMEPLCARVLELIAQTEARREVEQLALRATFGEEHLPAAFSIALEHEAQREAAGAMYARLATVPLSPLAMVRDARRFARQLLGDLDVIVAKLEGAWGASAAA